MYPVEFLAMTNSAEPRQTAETPTDWQADIEQEEGRLKHRSKDPQGFHTLEMDIVTLLLLLIPLFLVRPALERQLLLHQQYHHQRASTPAG
jgi:hypothetical protein